MRSHPAILSDSPYPSSPNMPTKRNQLQNIASSPTRYPSLHSPLLILTALAYALDAHGGVAVPQRSKTTTSASHKRIGRLPISQRHPCPAPRSTVRRTRRCGLVSSVVAGCMCTVPRVACIRGEDDACYAFGRNVVTFYLFRAAWIR